MIWSSRGEFAEDLLVGAVGGYVGTKVMEPVSSKLYQRESQRDRQCEDAARPGPPFQVAADKTLDLLGIHLPDPVRERAGMVVHYGLGISWAPVYAVLRRAVGLNPAVAGLLTGASMSLIVDEMLTPLLGFSAADRAYPVSTHVRGFLAHLAYGAVTAAVIEGWWALRRRRP